VAALYFGRAHTALAAALRSVVRPAAVGSLTPVVLRGMRGSVVRRAATQDAKASGARFELARDGERD